jgi:hypothetical protein
VRATFGAAATAAFAGIFAGAAAQAAARSHAAPPETENTEFPIIDVSANEPVMEEVAAQHKPVEGEAPIDW